MGDDTLTIVMVGMMVGSLLLVTVLWCSICRDNGPSELRAQLIPGQHRIDAVTREAEVGFALCRGCAFENFKRFTHCSRCGETLSTETADAMTSVSDGNNSSSDVTDSDNTNLTTAPLTQLTPAQIRVRRRKEWTRRLDVDGNMFWYRSCVHNSVGSQLPGLVIRFSDLQPDDDSTDPTLEQVQQQATAAASATTTTAPTVAASICRAAERTTMALVSSAEANAAIFPTGATLASTDCMTNAIDLVTRDFPTKYAHFVVSTASLIVPVDVEFLKMAVRRAFVLEESIDNVSCIPATHIHSAMRIAFKGESGVDAGGVSREWFVVMNELLLAPALQLFVCVDGTNQLFYLNAQSQHDVGDQHLTYYYAVGRFVGRALLEGQALSFHLALPLLKIILGLPVSFQDLESFDPALFKSLVWLNDHDNVDALGLTFSVTERRSDGQVVEIDLVPNGCSIDVTDANKHEYVDRKFRYLLFESVASQLYVFLKGLYEVIPMELLMLFDAEEFDYVLCGSSEIDVDDWQKHTRVGATLVDHKAVTWFWEVVRAMPSEYKRRLLQFATGCSRVPLSGFAGLTSYDGRLCLFTLKGVPYYAAQYISSHACFNRLDLPLYSSKRELQVDLFATLETDQYGFTTV